MIKDKKQAAFKEFCDSLTPSKTPSLILKQLKGFKIRATQNTPMSKDQNIPAENPQVIEAFDKITKRHVVRNMEENWVYPHDNDGSLTREVTPDELEHAISSSKLKSAPGMDHVSYEIIKHLPAATISRILAIFNCIIESGKIPETWHQYKVSFIPKPHGRGYRPIAMSGCMLKILERIINDRLTWWIESKAKLPNCFNGFRRGKSCYDNFLDLRLEMDIARIQGLTTGVVFIDITGAYDNVNVETLIDKLKDLRLPPKLVRFIGATLKSRTLTGLAENQLIGTKTTNKGLPQGSILSPLLFNSYMTGIGRKFPAGINVSSFADDFRISYSNASAPEILKLLKKGLLALEVFLKDRSLSISFDKTQLILINYQKKKEFINPYTKQITIRNHTLVNVPAARYLGVIWDFKLNWEDHIALIRKKTSKLLNILASIAKFKWGGHPTVLLRIYKSLIRPALGLAGFLSNPDRYEQLSKLNTIRNSALRISLGCMRTTPINILLHLSGTTTLKERLEELSRRFLVKKLSYCNNTLEPKLKKIQSLKIQPHIPDLQRQDSSIYHIWQDMKGDLREVEKRNTLETFQIAYEALFIRSQVISSKGALLKPPKGVPGKFRAIVNEDFPHHRIIYTDGSLNRELQQSGIGIFDKTHQRANKSISLNPNNSIFSAEMYAMRQAIRSTIATDDPSDILICADSLSAVNKLQRKGLCSDISPNESEVRQFISSEREKGRNISILWIPAHCGIMGNEEADYLAKAGSTKKPIEVASSHYQDILPIYKQKAITNTEEFIQRYASPPRPKGRYYAVYAGNFKPKPWFQDLGLDRKRISLASRVKSGHTKAKAHLKRMNIIDDDRCQCGEEVESVDHLIT